MLNISGYKFITLSRLPDLKEQLLALCHSLSLKGTILLSEEGININLAGAENDIQAFQSHLKKISLFSNITFRQSYAEIPSFEFMQVKIKKEIITMLQSEIRPDKKKAPAITALQLKDWLDQKKEITLLDTRNSYEIKFGTFKNAVNLNINDFSEFPDSSQKLSQDKPIVMFCTGGIRCEKAALHLLNLGFNEVYQLEGGILQYFTKVGKEYFEGECFVFDQRVALNPDLKPSGTQQCTLCEGPIKAMEEHFCSVNT